MNKDNIIANTLQDMDRIIDIMISLNYIITEIHIIYPIKIDDIINFVVKKFHKNIIHRVYDSYVRLNSQDIKRNMDSVIIHPNKYTDQYFVGDCMLIENSQKGVFVGINVYPYNIVLFMFAKFDNLDNIHASLEEHFSDPQITMKFVD